MGRSQESFGKKEREKKRQKKKEEKARRKAERQANDTDKGDNITYVDKYGNFSDTPPTPEEKVDASEIEISIPKKEDREDHDDLSGPRQGVVTMFNNSKAYGFIKDKATQESFFVHVNNVNEPIVEQNIVTFEIADGPKGPMAVNVSVVR